MIAEHALDYTSYAPPLSVADVKRDLDAHANAHLDYPDKLIMWGHQWLWLAHSLGMADITINDIKPGDNRLFGIAVDVLKP